MDICFLLNSILKGTGLSAELAHSIEDAKTIIHSCKPSLIFLDNHLPDGLGLDFIAYIKEHFPLSRIAMMTAYDSDTDRNQALTNGCHYFVSKPFTRNVILDILNTHH